MVQRTLYEYFRPQHPRGAHPKTTFLDLQYDLRRRIYLHAGLPSNSTIYLNYLYSSNESCIQEYDRNDPEHWPIEEKITARSQSLSYFLDGYLPWPEIRLNRHCACLELCSWQRKDCTCDALPYQLLYVSKTVADEVSSIFYSENHFSVFQNSLGGLSGFRSLPKGALARMTSLSICLNFFDDNWDREFGPEIWCWCHGMCSATKKERLLWKAKRHDEVVSMKEWQRLCRDLKAHIQPNQLRLSLICDVADVESADEVAHPFLQLPVLRDCAIRLGSIYLRSATSDSGPLQQLARQTADKMTDRSTERTFRYTDLPNEVQLQILEHSDLVSPFDLIWAFNTNVARDTRMPFYEYRTFKSPSEPWDFICCRQCSPLSEACSCWPKHAAFSTTCTCWRMPLSLFLICRKMKQDAEFVFYSKNHFLLLPKRWTNSKKLEIYNFLTLLPKNGRRYLQSVSWNLSDQQDGYLRPGDRTHREWLEALQIIAHEIPPLQLRLTVDPGFNLASIYYYRGGDHSPVPAHHYIKEAENTWAICERLAKILADHDVRLKDFFFHFMWPVEGSKDGMERNRGRVLEKMVMGNAYEGTSRGKDRRRWEWNGYHFDERRFIQS